MKKLIFILFAFIILGCNQNFKKKGDLLGTWGVVSSTDVESGEVELPESDNLVFVEFKTDSLYLISNFEVDQVFAWRIEGDSIFLKEGGSAYIKELTNDELIVEYDFLGKIQLTLKKRK
jgi:hypothetical protein